MTHVVPDPTDQFHRSIVSEHYGSPRQPTCRSVTAGPPGCDPACEAFDTRRHPKRRTLTQSVDLGQVGRLLAKPGLHIGEENLGVGEAPIEVGEAIDLLHLFDNDEVAVVGFRFEPPRLALILGDDSVPWIPAAAVADRPPSEVGPVESDVAHKPKSAEKLGPVLRRADVDVRLLAVVVRGGGEEHVVGHTADVAQRRAGVLLLKVLQHLDAGHQVKAAVDRIEDAAHLEIRANVRAGLGNREV